VDDPETWVRGAPGALRSPASPSRGAGICWSPHISSLSQQRSRYILEPSDLQALPAEEQVYAVVLRYLQPLPAEEQVYAVVLRYLQPLSAGDFVFLFAKMWGRKGKLKIIQPVNY
jgi:hypothetical protein